MIYQGLRPRTVSNKLEKLGCPQKTYSALIGFSDSMLSLFLSGSKGLSYQAQSRGFRVLRWLEELAAESPTPIDFRQTETILHLWQEYEKQSQEGEVLRLAQELEAE